MSYGWKAVARNPDVFLKDIKTTDSKEYTLDDLTFPDSKLIQATLKFAKDHLPKETFNHSQRVYIYGAAIVKAHFPSWDFDFETYYLSCLLHDIGTAPAYLLTTKMSFEFKGAIVAREYLLQNEAPEDQADAVCEAIIRHQDIFVEGGNITEPGQILQLATILDNVGKRAELVHSSLFELVTKAHPKLKWSSCFAGVILEEENAKPWCHTTTFEPANWKPGESSNFADDVRGNNITGTNYE